MPRPKRRTKYLRAAFATPYEIGRDNEDELLDIIGLADRTNRDSVARGAECIDAVEEILGEHAVFVRAVDGAPTAASVRPTITALQKHAEELGSLLAGDSEAFALLTKSGLDVREAIHVVDAVANAATAALQVLEPTESRGRPAGAALKITVARLGQLFETFAESDIDPGARRRSKLDFVNTALSAADIEHPFGSGGEDLAKLIRSGEKGTS